MHSVSVYLHPVHLGRPGVPYLKGANNQFEEENHFTFLIRNFFLSSFSFADSASLPPEIYSNM